MHKQTWCKQGVDMGDDPLKEATVEGLGKCVSADNGHLARIRAANRFAAGKRGLGCQGARQLLCIQPKKLRNCSTRRVACRDGQKERERVCVCVCVRERECVCVCGCVDVHEDAKCCWMRLVGDVSAALADFLMAPMQHFGNWSVARLSFAITHQEHKQAKQPK